MSGGLKTNGRGAVGGGRESPDSVGRELQSLHTSCQLLQWVSGYDRMHVACSGWGWGLPRTSHVLATPFISSKLDYPTLHLLASTQSLHHPVQFCPVMPQLQYPAYLLPSSPTAAPTSSVYV